MRYWLRLGSKGERIARRYLESRGYIIRHTNWRCKIGELDIVAQENHALVFVEVKSRCLRVDRTYSGIEAVDKTKSKRLELLSEWYCRDFESDIRYRRLRKVRFEIISIVIKGFLRRPIVRHVQLKNYHSSRTFVEPS